MGAAAKFQSHHWKGQYEDGEDNDWQRWIQGQAYMLYLKEGKPRG